MTKNKKNLNGYTMIEMLLVLGLITIIMMTYVFDQHKSIQHTKAKILGEQIRVYANAVKNYIDDKGIKGPPALTTTTGYTLTARDLLSVNCQPLAGNSDTNYLPCNFSGSTVFGHGYSTEVRLNTSNEITATTVFSNITIAGEPREDIARIAVNAAYGSDYFAPHSGGSVDYSVNGTGANPPVNIVATVHGRPEIDPWLRRDGTNAMTGDFNAGNYDIKNIGTLNAVDANISDSISSTTARIKGNILADGDIAARNIVSETSIEADTVIANQSLTTPLATISDSAVIGSPASPVDALTVNGISTFNGSLAVSGDVRSSGTVEAVDMVIPPTNARGYSPVKLSQSARTYTISSGDYVNYPKCGTGKPKIDVAISRISLPDDIGESVVERIGYNIKTEPTRWQVHLVYSTRGMEEGSAKILSGANENLALVSVRCGP
jgi:prepilin-type N-terminal cleavage/methylation domain-containing protein